MGNLTNNLGLPESIVNAVAFPAYSSGGSDITVTQLIKPPQMVALEKVHRDEITEDVSDRIWALFGSATHYILEKSVGEGDIAEQRVFTTINGWRVSGQFDLITKDGSLQDFKTTSVWSVMDAVKNGKDEWEQQLNLLAALVRLRTGDFELTWPDLSSLKIVAICRDWRNSESLRNPDYPGKVELVDIPMWDEEVAYNFLTERVNLHMAAQLSGNVLPCTDSERWYKGEKWAVMKKGRKSALRLLDTEQEAIDWMEGNGGTEIVHRHGTYGRCENYCSVSKFCPQWSEHEQTTNI